MSEQPNQPNDRPETPRDDVESASLDSFPASDPPKWSSLRLGPPTHSAAAAERGEEPSSTADRQPLDGNREKDK